MHQSPEFPVPVLTHQSRRRAALRALGVVAALTSAFQVGSFPTSANRGRTAKKKKRKQGPAGPAGPAGPTGPQGPVGPVGITSATHFDDEQTVLSKVGQITTSTVLCPAGAIATGGGYNLAGLVGSVPTVNVLFSGMAGNGWQVKLIRMVATGQTNDLTLQASVVCTSTF